MSAPPLLRPPGSGQKNPRSPKLKLPTLSVSQTSSNVPKPSALYLPNLNTSTSTQSSIISATNKLSHLDISDQSKSPSTATSDNSLGIFSAEIIAEVDSTHSVKESNHSSSNSLSLQDSLLKDGQDGESTYTNSKNKDVEELDEENWKLVSKQGEIIELGVLGEGAGGSVSRCKLKNGNTIFALKTIISGSTGDTQKQILRELQFNKSCKSPYIVKYYGTFLDEESASICISMEYMGGRSLDAIYKRVKLRGGIIGEKVLGKVAESVLKGLSYLHEHRIIHRDIKPQNILLNLMGEVKLCDFGVSGVVVDSLATTFTGTSYYMAPERIQGHPYSVTSDVWSLGLTLLEVAKGRFPLENDIAGASIIEVLTLIMTFSPKLEDDGETKWTDSFRSFIDYCLKKNPAERASPRQMLSHPWVVYQMKKNVNMEKFIKQCWEDI